MSKVFGKDYKEINESDLNEFVNGLCSRMLLFGKDFPSFLPYLVSEVVNHPSINLFDKEQLESYCDMFEMQWREDPLKPLLASPVYLKDNKKMDKSALSEKQVSERMRKAGIPYMNSIKNKIIAFTE
jgi:hypothetical protein